MLRYETYSHYDARSSDDGDLLPASDEHVRQATYAEIATLALYNRMTRETLPLTPDDEQAIDEAWDYVENASGKRPTAKVYKVAELPGGTNGQYVPAEHAVLFTSHPTGTQYGDKMLRDSLLTHEGMHSTAEETHRVVGVKYDDKHELMWLPPHQDEEISTATKTDYYIEEAVAEHIAGQRRQERDPRLVGTERDLRNTAENFPIPVRFFDTTRPLDDRPEVPQSVIYVNSAYCAFGIQMLSEYTGVDLFQHLIDARYPERRAEAIDALRTAINGVKPGLYEELMSGEYSLDDFMRGTKTIQQAIAEHAIATHCPER